MTFVSMGNRSGKSRIGSLVTEMVSLGLKSSDFQRRALTMMKNQRSKADLFTAYEQIVNQERAKQAANALVERLLA